MSDAMLWCLKHAPSLEEFAGNMEAVEAARKWAINWKRGKAGKPLLFHGPSGSGKTALALALAAAMGWEVIELNASDLRTREEMARRAGAAGSAGTLTSSQRLLLIDEIDGLQSADRGGGTAALELATRSRHPLIFTANDYWSPSLSRLRAACTGVEFKRINAHDIERVLKGIAKREGVSASQELLSSIAQESGGDIRGAINDLQAACDGGAPPTSSLGQREREKKVFSALRAMFKSTSFSEARRAPDGLDLDHDLFKKWVDENIPLEYEGAGELARAFDALSRADVFDGRIIRRQHWGFLRYSSDLLTAGVALAKAEPYRKFTAYSFPTFIRALSASKAERGMEKRISLKVGKALHCSSKEARECLPLLAMLAEKAGIRPLAEWLGLDEEEEGFFARRVRVGK